MRKVYILLVFLFLNNFNYCFSQEPPVGFIPHLTKAGDTLSKIVPKSQWKIIMQINKIDEEHLPLNKIIFIPVNMERARKFTPLPTNVCSKRSERLIYISLANQFFGAYEKGRLVFWGPISSGKSKYKTPKGEFKVLWKSRKYRSKRYSQPMPYAINISAAGYFLHQQSLPGKPASRGCIRLLNSDAEKLFKWSKINDPVLIE
ncbi:hypothetical protein A2999_01400 [Candidatus Wolfebacteria bacterium RIFCSPLOWO2_01_FULL_38_11]|uniref:L,D-TPase catalytic domain-containing protein n=1 Tax=Candidatus Wolfebacteria bacterium RIFCSPLOWO2_01_FULL_38_11 TaxID=1802556 RepID=A0A1F8DPA4_9BACT|nr:MAG: hypothetical protein A2999_01400 [Candidatus Wolfebacteria bacterium RIFCSPLOWO2_01_FULL_38_11]